MAESKRLVSDKIGGGNFYFLQPDATTYHMVKPGGGVLLNPLSGD